MDRARIDDAGAYCVDDGVLAAAAVLVAPSSAAVRKISFTSSVNTNDEAALTVTVSPRARCTIKVVYDTTVSHAKGLGPKTGTRSLGAGRSAPRRMLGAGRSR